MHHLSFSACLRQYPSVILVLEEVDCSESWGLLTIQVHHNGRLTARREVDLTCNKHPRHLMQRGLGPRGWVLGDGQA